ncbi:hypothetical protein GRJ2_001225700 [Grus japonensis]|uniref:Uncharacterized protein n=1 Tax=Grus japonensis TaxID=30415 RepID=A0ABC9WQ69_GRUJA
MNVSVTNCPFGLQCTVKKHLVCLSLDAYCLLQPVPSQFSEGKRVFLRARGLTSGSKRLCWLSVHSEGYPHPEPRAR